MPNSISNVSFQQVNPYSLEIQDIERRRRLAEALQQQGMSPLGNTEMVGGWAIPRSPMEGVGKIAQALSGALQQKKASDEEKALGVKYQEDLNSTLSRALQAGSGAPGTSENIMDEQANNGEGAVRSINAPAIAPNSQRMASILMEHPGTQALGQQQLAQEMSRKALIAALSGGGASAGTPGGSGQSSAAVGGAAGGVPMAAWLQADPTGKTYMEQLAKDYGEGQKPVINRGFGVGRMVNGVYVPDSASSEQAAKTAGAVEAAKSAAASPYSMQQMEVPVYLPGGDQINVKMTSTQAHEYQTTGKLPESIAASIPGLNQQQLPAGVPAEDAKAFQYVQAMDKAGVPATANMQNGQLNPNANLENIPAVPGSARPVIGRTQSQTEQIRQEGQKAANVEGGKEFIAEMRQNYAKLRDVPATLENIERAKGLAATEARNFMGPFGESKLAITKFMRSNIPGMSNLKTEGVTNAEELQSTLFNQVMDNLKKMDASPSQYQQQVMQEAFGTLRTDPQSVPKILDVFSDILKNRVAIHNETVTSAEGRGTTFPYDVKVKLPEGKTKALEQKSNVRVVNW